jgi:hypothetical protein
VSVNVEEEHASVTLGEKKIDGQGYIAENEAALMHDHCPPLAAFDIKPHFSTSVSE